MKFQCSQLVDGSGCKTSELSCLLLCYNFINLHLQTSYEVG